MTEKKSKDTPEESTPETKPEATPAEASSESKNETKSTSPERSGGVAGPLALAGVVLLMILVAGAAWHFHQQLLALETAQTDLASAAQFEAFSQQQEARLGDVAGRVDALNTALESRLEAIARLENRMADQRESAQVLADRVDQLYRRMQSETDDWRLAEAAYLGRIAIHRLQFNADVAGALEALEAADVLLAGLGGSAIDRREAIARATDRLLEASPPDRAGINRSLSDLADALPGLPLAEGLRPQAEQNPTSSMSQSDATEPSWQGRAERAWAQLREGLGELVVISRDRQVQPLPDPASRFLLEQNLMLQVETARLAALRGEAAVFNQSIARIGDWVDAYFDSGSSAVTAVQEQLQALSRESVAFTPPAIGNDLAPLFNGNALP